MKIISKAGIEFLEIETFGDSAHLNPFQINIDKIRYIREFTDERDKSAKLAWAIIIGNKMYATKDDLGLNSVKVGDTVKLGSIAFKCEKGSGLTEKGESRYLVNYNNILFCRKFISNDVDKTNKNDRKVAEIPNNLNKFAIVTIDERIIPINK